jgi:hypothetical protein
MGILVFPGGQWAYRVTGEKAVKESDVFAVYGHLSQATTRTSQSILLSAHRHIASAWFS